MTVDGKFWGQWTNSGNVTVQIHGSQYLAVSGLECGQNEVWMK